jgi:hypothetical protein
VEDTPCGSPAEAPRVILRSVIDKEHILAEIKRTAAANGGGALGRARFETETGIGERDTGRYWARWSDAVIDAGLAPNPMQDRFDDERLASHLVDETRRLGRFPTSRELRLRHALDRSFPDARVFQNRWRRQEQIAQIAALCREQPGYEDVLTIVEPLVVAPEDQTQEPHSRAPRVVFGEVYLLRSGRNYKLGRTNAFGRRERELAIQLPERATTVHVIKTDDPVGIEAYWHARFADRRGNGEWFALTAADVAAFRRRKFM